MKEVQCFAHLANVEDIPLEALPQLAYISKTVPESSVHPRVMHSHEDLCELVLIWEGEADYSIGGRERRVHCGDLIVYNSGVIHDERYGRNVPIASYCIAMRGLKLRGLRENALIPDNDNPVFPSGSHFEALRDTMSLMFDALCTNADGCGHYCRHQLLGVLSRVWALRNSAPAAASVQPNLLGSRIKALIDLHYTEDISLQSLADGLHISPYYLSHVFKDMTGYAPGQYITRRRVGLAQNLLISTNMPVSDIAARVGYPSPSHFHDRFTKNVGMSPSAYRKTYIVHSESQESASLDAVSVKNPPAPGKQKART